VKFAAVIEYVQDKAKIQELRPLHRQYLTQLKERGQLVWPVGRSPMTGAP
jgi:uncharacterized protein YciI